jgi:hypothetical protein
VSQSWWCFVFINSVRKKSSPVAKLVTQEILASLWGSDIVGIQGMFPATHNNSRKEYTMGTVSVDAKMRAFPFREVRVPVEEIPPGTDPMHTSSSYGTFNDELFDEDMDDINQVLLAELGDTLDCFE